MSVSEQPALPDGGVFNTKTPMRRSQTITWNEDLTATWQENKPDETLAMRCERYCSYMRPTQKQLYSLGNRIEKLVQGMIAKPEQSYRAEVKYNASSKDFSLMADQYDDGTAYCIYFGARSIRAARVCKNGEDVEVQVEEQFLITPEKDFTAANVSAFELAELIVKTVARLPREEGKLRGVAFVTGFNCTFRQPGNCILRNWSRGMETGNATDDPCVGGDLGAMIDYAFKVQELPFEVAGCFPTSQAAFETAITEVETDERSDVRFVVDLEYGMSFAGVRQSTNEIIDVPLGSMSDGLPLADFDLEVDDADGNYNTYLLEKLSGALYIGETARRVIIKVLTNQAPEKAWTMNTLPVHALAKIAWDSTEDLTDTRALCQAMWDWDCPKACAVEIKRICYAVSSRSAALVAAAIVANARAFHALQPALGKAVLAVAGEMYAENELYQKLIVAYLEGLVGKTLSTLIELVPVKKDHSVGGALMLLKK